jgi:hypothetical protein
MARPKWSHENRCVMVKFSHSFLYKFIINTQKTLVSCGTKTLVFSVFQFACVCSRVCSSSPATGVGI